MERKNFFGVLMRCVVALLSIEMWILISMRLLLAVMHV